MKLNQNLMADIFQDNMILPLHKDLKIGGKITAFTTIKLSFNKKVFTTKSNQQGYWQVKIPAVDYPQMIATISAETADDEETIQNIKFGKVYLLSGQSNIEYRLKDEANYKKVKEWLSNKQYSDLYFYNVPQVDYIDTKTGEVKPKDLQSEKWHEITAENVGPISAIGFYMLKALRDQEVKGPLAIVDCFKGGTSASVWIKKNDLAADPELNKAFLIKYQQIIAGKTWADFDRETATYNQTVEKHNHDLAHYLKMHPDTSLSTAKNIVGHTPWPPPYRPDLYTRPCGLYTTMLQQIKNCVFNAMVWYQGENDTDRSKQYHKLLPLLLKTWRRTLNDASLPVKLIQLPGYADYPNNSGAIIRNTQLDIAFNTPEVDLVSFIDGGEEHNIHPTHKQKMGERLGKIISGNNYAGTPFVDNIKVKDGKLVLSVSRCEKIKLKQKALLHLEFDTGQKKEYEIKSSNLLQNQIIIKTGDQRINSISYNYCNYPESVGLYNELSYPVSPFKFDLTKKMIL